MLEIMDFYLSLISTLVGLVLINLVVLLKAQDCWSGWIGDLPVEVRYVTFFLGILLISLNGNQWISGEFLFPILAVAATIVVVSSWCGLAYPKPVSYTHLTLPTKA